MERALDVLNAPIGAAESIALRHPVKLFWIPPVKKHVAVLPLDAEAPGDICKQRVTLFTALLDKHKIPGHNPEFYTRREISYYEPANAIEQSPPWLRYTDLIYKGDELVEGWGGVCKYAVPLGSQDGQPVWQPNSAYSQLNIEQQANYLATRGLRAQA